MSVFNLGLQSIGLMHESKDAEYEKVVEGCKNLSDLRAAAEKNEEFKATTLDSIAPVKVLLTHLFNRLQLKEEDFTPVVAAAEESIEDLWSSIQGRSRLQ